MGFALNQSLRTVTVRWSRVYHLTPASVLQSAPALPGVYEILLGFQDGSTRRRYVGQAIDLASRLMKHARESDNDCVRNLAAKYRCFFRYALLVNQWERDGAERGLYLRHHHACNDAAAIPAGPDVTLTEQ